MRLDRRHWTLAVLTACGLHAGVALAMFWPQAEPGAEAPGVGGIEIALGPAGGAPGGEAAPETTETEEAAEETAAEMPAQSVAEPDSAEAVPDPEPVETTPDEDRPVETETVVETVAVKPTSPPRPKPEPEPAREDPMQQANATPERAPETPPRPDVPPATAEPSTAGAGGKAGSQDSPEAGAGASDASAGGAAGAEADYAAVLLAWLERHKEYPRRAKLRRQQGVVMLYIEIDRAGRVIEVRIDTSAGHDILDDAALAMLERAAPLPPLPDDMPNERLEMVVPVQFFLR